MSDDNRRVVNPQRPGGQLVDLDGSAAARLLVTTHVKIRNVDEPEPTVTLGLSVGRTRTDARLSPAEARTLAGLLEEAADEAAAHAEEAEPVRVPDGEPASPGAEPGGSRR